jgi:5-formyltetrahydrofolate cyclo-ligase
VEANARRAEKRRLRAWARRSAPLGATAAPEAQARLLACEPVRRARVVCLYSALPDEVPTRSIARALVERGVGLVYPRVEGSRLWLGRVASPAELAPGYRGVLEPPHDAPAVEPADVDVFVVPGLLFSRAGDRLGRGGGFYDRLLSGAGPRARAVGLCYADRVVEQLPRASWDQRVDCIVTERAVIRVERRTPEAGRGD